MKIQSIKGKNKIKEILNDSNNMLWECHGMSSCG